MGRLDFLRNSLDGEKVVLGNYATPGHEAENVDAEFRSLQTDGSTRPSIERFFRHRSEVTKWHPSIPFLNSALWRVPPDAGVSSSLQQNALPNYRIFAEPVKSIPTSRSRASQYTLPTIPSSFLVFWLRHFQKDHVRWHHKSVCQLCNFFASVWLLCFMLPGSDVVKHERSDLQ